MKQTKIIILLTMLFTMTVFAACGADTADEDGETAAISFTDMTGNQITMDAPAEKIVVLTAADCEILYALGAGDRITARGEYCDYPAEVFDLPSIQSGSETNIEQIIAMEPDAVVMGTMDQPEEQRQALRDAGITVVCSDADDIAGTYETIHMLGMLTGKNQEAETMIADMKAVFEDIQLTASLSPVSSTIYFEVSPLQYGLWAAGTETFMHEIAQMLQITNIFEDVQGWVEVSEEQVLSRNPNYIVTVGMSFEGMPAPDEEIMGRAGWQDIDAVKNGHVISLPNNEITRPGPRLAEAAKTLCDIIYPNIEAQ